MLTVCVHCGRPTSISCHMCGRSVCHKCSVPRRPGQVLCRDCGAGRSRDGDSPHRSGPHDLEGPRRMG